MLIRFWDQKVRSQGHIRRRQNRRWQPVEFHLVSPWRPLVDNNCRHVDQENGCQSGYRGWAKNCNFSKRLLGKNFVITTGERGCGNALSRICLSVCLSVLFVCVVCSATELICILSKTITKLEAISRSHTAADADIRYR